MEYEAAAAEWDETEREFLGRLRAWREGRAEPLSGAGAVAGPSATAEGRDDRHRETELPPHSPGGKRARRPPLAAAATAWDRLWEMEEEEEEEGASGEQSEAQAAAPPPVDASPALPPQALPPPVLTPPRHLGGEGALVENLAACGFARERARAALARCSGSPRARLNAAFDMLLEPASPPRGKREGGEPESQSVGENLPRNSPSARLQRRDGGDSSQAGGSSLCPIVL